MESSYSSGRRGRYEKRAGHGSRRPRRSRIEEGAGRRDGEARGTLVLRGLVLMGGVEIKNQP